MLFRSLVATGQLPAAANPTPAQNQAQAKAPDQVERDLLELKLKQQPGRRLRDAQEVRLAAELGWRLDVNRATAADWLRLPGMAADQVDLLMRLQAGGVQLSGPDDLAQLLELPPATVASWQPLLQYRWYGEPPAAAAAPRLDLNHANAHQLEQLGLSRERCRQIGRAHV